MLRIVLKGVVWLMSIGVLALVALFGINATDEALSEDAQTALRVPSPPPASESNGFIDFLALGAPAAAPTYATGLKQLAAYREQSTDKLLNFAIDPRIPSCRADFLSCVAAAPGPAELRELIDSHDAFLKRYRVMRDKPEFDDLLEGGSPEDAMPSYQWLTNGHRLSLMRAAIDFNGGERERAIEELEAEFAFYRRVAAGSRTLLPKMIAFAMLDSAAMFAAELARKMSLHETALWARFKTLLRAPTKAELDVTAVLNQEMAQRVRWMRSRRYVRLSANTYEMFKSIGEARSRPWWDPVAPWLYRPHYSVNRYVTKARIMQALAELPPKDFLGALDEHRARAQAVEPAEWWRLVLSPAGHHHINLEGYDVSGYLARVYSHAGVQALAALQVRLRAAGITKPLDVLKTLQGSLGSAYPDPFTGKPFGFDQQHMTIGFACEPNYVSGVARILVVANARVELPL